MKIVYTGLESSGKTLWLSVVVRQILARNKRWYNKYGFKRIVYSNIKFSEDIEERYEGFIEYWTDIRHILGNTGCDIIWDEISTDLSAQKKEPLPRRFNIWFRQGAKQGVHIYATAQEFHDIHLDFRRRVLEAYVMRKIIGSPRRGENIPDIKFIWGIISRRKLHIHPYNEIEPEYVDRIGGFFLIDKAKCSVFDTNATIDLSAELPYEHIIYGCEKDEGKKLCQHLPKYKRHKHR